ncbi:MAG TPA: ATP-binding cassette domain-containing protein, partial [Bacteroidia bacterium]|nr:ATP-binding cassette domain-containing protein [Bacteroidia bacterium]
TQVSKLSGGELKRLQLLTVLLKNPNFLILDEPTNDLDITTLNILEEFLSDYAGCMLLVTHDRYFMDRLVDHVFVLDGTGTIRDIHGNYSAYRQMDKKSPSTAVQKEIPAQAKPPKERKQKRSYKEQKEFESLESSINVLEQRKTELEAILSGSTSNPEIVQKAVEEYAQVEADIHTQTARWLELADIATQS